MRLANLLQYGVFLLIVTLLVKPVGGTSPRVRARAHVARPDPPPS